jgi:hypothetical protein
MNKKFIIKKKESRKKSETLKALSFSALSLAFFILIINIISSAQVTNVNTQQGYQIFFPDYSSVKQNYGFELHIQVSNISDGKQINNSLINCYLNLYNSSGLLTVDEVYLTKDTDYYGLYKYIEKENFTDLGQHAFYISCEGQFGGEAFGTFEVTPTGSNDSNNLLFFIIFFIIAYGVGFFGFFGKNKLVSFLGGIAMILLGIYMVSSGIIVYRSTFTVALSYITLGLGFIFMLVPAVESIQENL